MPHRYSVNLYDRAGPYDSTEVPDFATAAAVARRQRAAHPDKVVVVFNLNRCDVGSDGLTEEERDALDEVAI